MNKIQILLLDYLQSCAKTDNKVLLAANTKLYAYKIASAVLTSAFSQCPTCGRFFEDEPNKEFVGKVGECINCDHLRTEEVINASS